MPGSYQKKLRKNILRDCCSGGILIKIRINRFWQPRQHSISLRQLIGSRGVSLWTTRIHPVQHQHTATVILIVVTMELITVTSANEQQNTGQIRNNIERITNKTHRTQKKDAKEISLGASQLTVIRSRVKVVGGYAKQSGT